MTVHRVEPDRAAAGDRVSIAGDGFPEGRRATVVFRGDLSRPGVPKERDVAISAPVVAAGRNALTLVFDRALERRFAGAFDNALHTTFHGDVRVTFEPGAAGATAVSGTLRGAVFDVLPSTATPGETAARDREGARALELLGLETAVDPGGSGLVVAAVAPGGRGERAGVFAGDRLSTFDDVSILSTADVRPRGGERVGDLSVERSGERVDLSVNVDGIEPLDASDLVTSATLVLIAALVLLIPATRFGFVLRFLARLAEMRRSRRDGRRAATSVVAGVAGALLPPPSEGFALGIAALLTLAVIAVAFIRIACGHVLVSADLDLGLLAFGSTGALLATRFVDGGRREGSWSLTRAFRSLLQGLGCALPGLAAIGGAVLASGRFVIGEMGAAQGGAPWRWAAMQNPGLALAVVVLLASVLPEAHASDVLPAEGVAHRASEAPSKARALLRLAEWTYLWTVSGLAVALFLGGWRIPGASSIVQESSRFLSALGVLFFVAKWWSFVAVAGVLRWASGRITAAHVAALGYRWLLPLSLIAVVVATAFGAAADGARSSLVADLTGLVSTAIAAILAVCALLLAAPGRRPPATVCVNPWL